MGDIDFMLTCSSSCWCRRVLEIGVLTWSLATALVPSLAGFMPGLILSRILVCLSRILLCLVIQSNLFIFLSELLFVVLLACSVYPHNY